MKKSLILLPLAALLVACGPAAVSAAELKTVAENLQTVNSGEDFVAPTRATLTMNSEFTMTETGEEDWVSESHITAMFDASTGYYSAVGTEDDVEAAMYSYAEGTKYILAMAEGETKMYTAVECGSEELASAAAKAALAEMGFDLLFTSYAAGETELQTIVGWCDMIIANTDEDTTNDVDQGYTEKFNTTLTGSASDNNIDITITVDAAGSETEEGVTSGGALNGTFKVKFANGLLTYSLDEATMTEYAELEGERYEMGIISRQESILSYDAINPVYPNLSEYTLMSM